MHFTYVAAAAAVAGAGADAGSSSLQCHHHDFICSPTACQLCATNSSMATTMTTKPAVENVPQHYTPMGGVGWWWLLLLLLLALSLHSMLHINQQVLQAN